MRSRSEGNEVRRLWRAANRKMLRAAGRCINDTVVPSHEPAVKGGRCATCYGKHINHGAD